MKMYAIEIMKWLNFFLMAGLIGRFGIPPMLRWLDSESDATQASSQEAARKQAEEENRVIQARKKLEGVEKEAEEMKLLALHHAKVLLHTLKTETEEEIHRLRQFADYEVQRTEAEAKNTIQQEIVLQAVLVSDKILSSALTENDQRRMNRQFFKLIQHP